MRFEALWELPAKTPEAEKGYVESKRSQYFFESMSIPEKFIMNNS